MTTGLDWLRLMQLADSALPIGGAAHSFGLETLHAEGLLAVVDLPNFLSDWLSEVGVVDAVFCRAAHAGHAVAPLSDTLSALRPARESREASIALGRRLLQLAAGWDERIEPADIHLAVAFGYSGGRLGFDKDATVLAYLQQAVTALVSACQRLAALGQSRASRMLWDVKPAIIDAAERSGVLDIGTVGGFAPLLELASMRHPGLETRLFMS